MVEHLNGCQPDWCQSALHAAGTQERSILARTVTFGQNVQHDDSPIVVSRISGSSRRGHDSVHNLLRVTAPLHVLEMVDPEPGRCVETAGDGGQTDS